MEDLQSKAAVLIEALPYLKQFGGKRVVVKIGGELVHNKEAAASLVQDITVLRSVGVEVVLVHGAGPQITRIMGQMGKEAVFNDGHRVTDAETLDIVCMAMLGEVSSTVTALFNAQGKRAIGISGIDGGLFRVEQKDEALGYVGEIKQVNTKFIDTLIKDNFIPVIASLGVDDSGQKYNINADVAASELAKAMNAEKLVVLTNVQGLYEDFGDDNSLISEIDCEGLKALVESGKLTAGMLPKIQSILSALEGGVPKAHILDGRQKHAVLLEVFTPDGIGTMVTP